MNVVPFFFPTGILVFSNLLELLWIDNKLLPFVLQTFGFIKMSWPYKDNIMSL